MSLIPMPWDDPPKKAKKAKKKVKKVKKAPRRAKPSCAPPARSSQLPAEKVPKRGRKVGKASRGSKKTTVPKKCHTRPSPALGEDISEQLWPDCQDREDQREAWEAGLIPSFYPNGPYVPGLRISHGSKALVKKDSRVPGTDDRYWNGNEIPASRGMPDLGWFVDPEASGRQSGKIVVAFSGGKDSLACLLYVIEICLELDLNPSEVVECWHYCVDGRPWFYGGDGVSEFDWPVTEDYCRKVCACLQIPLYFGWREGGLMGEVLKGAADDPLKAIWEKALGRARPTAPMTLEMPDGSFVRTGGTGQLHVRRGFPPAVASLLTRWCTPLAKIDVSRSLLTNRQDLRGKRTLVVTGERAEESAARQHYPNREFDATWKAGKWSGRHGSRARHVEQWRPVHKWCEIDVWAIIYRWGIRPHPAYRLGWGRLSCMTCIFGSDRMWSSLKAIDSSRFRRFVNVEQMLAAEKEDLLEDMGSMTRAQLKKAAYQSALADLEAQDLDHKADSKARAEIEKRHKSGKLLKSYETSITGRVPFIKKDLPLTERTKPRWRNLKRDEQRAVKRGDALEAETRRIVKKGRRVLQVWEDAEPFPQTKQRTLVKIALSHRWAESPLMDPWKLPAGAFGEASGPS